MKKIITLICLVFFSISSFAQKGPRERMKAHKIAYITEKLDLTPKEAQQFWPIYNAHEQTMDELKGNNRRLIRNLKETNDGFEGLSDKQAGDFLANYMDIEQQKSQARKKLITNLQKVIPNKKILRLIKAEADFNKRILQRIREQRKRKN
ncbi:hypothetical protein M0D21_15760 [Aquimarina sp. D1M17]|uniref:hypothetical protein n=1 Tax=Aquimarina acroporae TaxID=2937283 RepID=UPI0020BE32F1|nr:hypothetical protein [Aquimarina acroporae]MCK8523034.1 hypothetical protein [Aquimarina acroporae]